jgi:hypothetical protein
MENSTPEVRKTERSRLVRMVLVSLAGLGGLLVLGKACGPTDSGSDPGKAPARAQASAGASSAESRSLGFDEVSIGQEYKTSVASQSHRVSQLEQELGSLRQNLEALKGELLKASGSQESQVARIEELTRLLERTVAAPPLPSRGDPAPKESDKTAGIRLVTFEAAPPKREPKKSLRIPAGSAAEGRVLNGVFAPTGGEPSPVRLKLEAAVLGPTQSRVPLKDAILVGKAQGDANATRVHVELVSFSYVKSSGQSIEVPVRGYVVGEDGMEGIPGTYLYRLDDQLPLVIATEGAAGFANALAQNETTTTLTPLGGATSIVSGNTLKFAGFKAAGGTSSKVGDILAERMKEIHPAVWTSADRPVKAVFLEGVTLEGIDPQEVKDEEPAPFRDLDPRR